MRKLYNNFFFKIFFTVIVLFYYLNSPICAETYFVAPRAEIPLRAGQGIDYRIITIMREGTEVEIISTDGAWANVRLKNGKEGWVLTRYLTKKEPLKRSVERLKSSLLSIQEKLHKERQKTSNLNKRLQECLLANTECENKREEVANKYNLLAEDAKNIIKFKKQHEDLMFNLENLKKKVTILERENSDLKKEKNITWFLAGSAVVIVGWIFGYLIGKKARKRTFTLL